MASERLFLDTSFVVARFNPRDQYHDSARRLAARLGDCRELWTTEAILLEIGAAFAAPAQRSFAVRIWSELKSLPFCRVAPISGGLLEKASDLFRNRADKSWSLADCASFVVMIEQRLTDAHTCDQHFVQTGFHALLLEEYAAG